MTITVPTTFADGDVPTAAQLNGNFSAVAARALTNSDIAANAAIDRTKLAQRYIPGTIWVPAISYTADTDLGDDGGSNDPALFTGLDTSWVEIHRFYFRVPAGSSMWLAAVDVWVEEAANSPELRFLVDSTVVGGSSALAVASGTKYSVAATNPFQNPQIPIADGSTFSVQLQDAGAGTSSIRGLDLSLFTKMELVE